MVVSTSSPRLDENGMAMSTPLPTPNDRLASVRKKKTHCSHTDNDNKVLVHLPMTLAASSAEVTLYGAWYPLLAEKKAGKSLESEPPNEATVTPSVSKYSSVRPISRMDFTPAHTTATGVLPSSVKSALTSRAVVWVYIHV